MRSHTRKALSLLLIISLFISIVGFFNTEQTYAATKKVHLKKTTISLVEGKTYQQKLINKNGKAIKATAVKWKSSKTSVAKIDKKGKIKAVKAGTAKMTAKYNGKTYKFTVKVKREEPEDPLKYTIGEKGYITSLVINMYYKADRLDYYVEQWDKSRWSASHSSINNIIGICNELMPLINQAREVTKNKYPKKCTSSAALSLGYNDLDELFAYAETSCLNVINYDKSKFGTLSGVNFRTYALDTQKAVNALYAETYLNSDF